MKNIKNAVVVRWKWKPKAPTPSPAPVPTPVVDTSTPIQYFLNDPATPALSKEIKLSAANNKPSFIVKGYKGGGYSPGTIEHQAACCFATITGTVQHYNNHTDKKIEKWATVPTLAIIPRAGVDLNAFYDRKSLQFFYMKDNRIGGTVYAVDSNDIVAHELGHAILDAYRPEMWSAAYLEVASFHECFGDFTAMMYALTFDEIVQNIIKETNGDLKNTNVVARLAEQLGKAIFLLANDGTRSPDYLRCAVNGFKYSNPGNLPVKGPAESLAAECHSFSIIFTGALYDIFVMMYESEKSAGKDLVSAVKSARDQISKYVLKAVQNAPLNARFYESMAKTILWADVTLSNRKFHDKMYEIFCNRGIIVPQANILSAAPCCPNDHKIVRTCHTLCTKLSRHLMRSQSSNPLYDVDVELPQEQVYLYDNQKNLIDMISVSHHQSITAGQDMIEYLHKTNKVSKDFRTPFEIKNGKLTRTHFDCGCCIR
jgi:hypothetical protein